jgi:hypothetical protein
MFHPTFNNISIISWRSVILVEDRRDRYPITSAVFTYRLNRLKPRASTFRGPPAQVYNIFNIVIGLSHLCCHNVLYFLNNPSVIFLTQLHSISEYCRILNTVHSKCINDQTLRSDIFLPKCPTNVRQIWESDILVGHCGLGRTFWSDVRVDIKRFFFYISRGEYVKHFVIDAYL